MQYYRLYRACDAQIVANFKAIKDTGAAGTYPNPVAREATFLACTGIAATDLTHLTMFSRYINEDPAHYGLEPADTKHHPVYEQGSWYAFKQPKKPADAPAADPPA